MKNKLTKFLPLVSVLAILAAGLSTGCQRNLVNQLPIANSFATTDESVEMLFGIGRLAERNGKTEKAIEAYQKILGGNPEHAGAMHRIGVIRAKQGLIDQSIAWLEKASLSEAPSAELIGDMGYVLYLAGDLSAAKSMLENGLQKKPEDARMTNNLAIVTGSMQQYNESMDLFRRHGTEAEALASIAYIQTQGGHVDAAKQNYLKSLELDGKLAVAANGLIELDRSSTNPESFLREPLNQIEMPAPVQLATYHDDEKTENPTVIAMPEQVVMPEEVVTNVAKAVAAVAVVEPNADADSRGVSSRIPTNYSGKNVVTLTSSDSLASNPIPVQPIKAEPLEAEPLPMERPVVDPEFRTSSNVPAVKGRLRGPLEIAVGKDGMFQLFVENTSSSTVNDIEVELTLGDAMEIVSVSHEAWLNEETNSVAWTMDELVAGEVRTIDFDALSNAAGTQTHRLTIKVDGQPVGELRLDTKVE